MHVECFTRRSMLFKRKQKRDKLKMKTEITIKLSRLNCNGCVRNVTKALQTLPEVEIVQIDIPTRAEMREAVTKCKVASVHVNYPIIVIPL